MSNGNATGHGVAKSILLRSDMLNIEIKALYIRVPTANFLVGRAESMKEHFRVCEECDVTATYELIEATETLKDCEIFLFNYRPSCLSVIKGAALNLQHAKILIKYDRR